MTNVITELPGERLPMSLLAALAAAFPVGTELGPVADLGGDEIAGPGRVVGQSLTHVTIERSVDGGKLRRIDVSWTSVAQRLEQRQRAFAATGRKRTFADGTD